MDAQPTDYTPAVLALAGTLLGALIGAVSGYMIARQSRQEARRARLLDRQIDLFASFLIDADVHSREVAAAVARIRQQTRHGPPLVIPDVNPTEPIRRTGIGLQVVAPSVTASMLRLYAAVVDLDLVTEPARLDPRRGMTPQQNADYLEAVRAYERSRQTFLEDVAREIGR